MTDSHQYHSTLVDSLKFVVRYILPAIVLITVLMLGMERAQAETGEMAPDFSLPSLKQIPSEDQVDQRVDKDLQAAVQRTISLSDYRGKVVYVDFWASWCAPCRIEMPMINALRNELTGQPFEIIGVNVDADPADALNFLERYPVEFPIVSDPIGKTSRLYRLTGFPSGFLITKEGRIAEATQGFHTGYIDHLRSKVTELMAKD